MGKLRSPKPAGGIVLIPADEIERFVAAPAPKPNIRKVRTMSEHDYAPLVLERLEHLHRSFEEMHRDFPKVNVYFLWPHADQWKFDPSDANLVLRAMRVESPDCQRTGFGYGEGYCYIEWAPVDPHKRFPSSADDTSFDDFTDILGRYRSFTQLEEWASSLKCLPFDWDDLALTLACTGLEHPTMLIRVHKEIITATPFRYSHSPDRPFCSVESDSNPDHPILWCAERTAETKHCLDFLCRTPVTVVRLRGMFDAAVKLVEATTCRVRALADSSKGEVAQFAPPKASGGTIIIQEYIAGDKNMTDDHSIGKGSINTNTQYGQRLTNCTNMIQQQVPADRKELLEQLDEEVRKLIEALREEQKVPAAKNYDAFVKEATSSKPDRRWYSVSAEGLLEASKWAKDFTGNIAGTLLNLGKTIWGADYKLPTT